MSERKSEAQALELTAFTRQGGNLQGEWPLARMDRLADSLWQPDASGAASFAVQGSQRPVTGAEPEVWLHLKGSLSGEMQCQRCLQGVAVALNVDRCFRFVRDEALAAKLDEESEDDVLVQPARLDVMELLEEELILGLPIVPMHEVCPQPLVTAAQTAAQSAEGQGMSPNPFAALAALRTRKPS